MELKDQTQKLKARTEAIKALNEGKGVYRCWYCGTIVIAKTGRLKSPYAYQWYCGKCGCRGPFKGTVKEALGFAVKSLPE